MSNTLKSWRNEHFSSFFDFFISQDLREFALISPRSRVLSPSKIPMVWMRQNFWVFPLWLPFGKNAITSAFHICLSRSHLNHFNFHKKFQNIYCLAEKFLRSPRRHSKSFQAYVLVLYDISIIYHIWKIFNFNKNGGIFTQSPDFSKFSASAAPKMCHFSRFFSFFVDFSAKNVSF